MTLQTTKPLEERKALLNQRLMQMTLGGARIESQSDTMAVVVYGKRVNHLLHFFIGVFTLGIWWIVWLLLALSGGEKRNVVTVDDFGNVTSRRT